MEPVKAALRRSLLLGVVVGSLGGGAASAQTLEGHIKDGGSFEPLANAVVVLLHPDGHALGDTVVTGPDGAFSLPVPGIGEYYVRVQRASYTPIVDGIFAFSGLDGRLDIEIFLLPRPVELEGIDVRVDRPAVRRQLRSTGFYERSATGFGDFISPAEIERRGTVANVSDYLRSIPGLSFYQGLVLFKDPTNRTLAGLNGERLGMCQPNVYVDGVRMIQAIDERMTERDDAGNDMAQLTQGDLGQSLDDYIHPDDIVGIEVYRHVSSTPLEWGGMNGSCGSIVIWTRRGR